LISVRPLLRLIIKGKEKPFLPVNLVPLSKTEAKSLPLKDGLAWYRIYGNDYYSQRNMVIGREWNIRPEVDGEWEISITRPSGTANTGYLVNVGKAEGQNILSASTGEVSKSLGVFKLAKGEVMSLKIHSATPGKELDEKDVSLRLIPIIK